VKTRSVESRVFFLSVCGAHVLTIVAPVVSLSIFNGQPLTAVQKRQLQPLRSLPALGGDPQVFLHAVVDRMCVGGVALPAYEAASAGDVAILADAYEQLFTQATKADVDAAQLAADLVVCGLADDVAALVGQVALARRDELRRAFVRSASQLASASLSAFDWKVHALVSSDRAAALHEPLALLQLRLNRHAPRAAEDVVIELTAADLTRLIDTLARVSAAVEELATS